MGGWTGGWVGGCFTFFIWNLMVALTVSIFSVSLSPPARVVGNLPALVRAGPNRRGICLIRESEARKALYCMGGWVGGWTRGA